MAGLVDIFAAALEDDPTSLGIEILPDTKNTTDKSAPSQVLAPSQAFNDSCVEVSDDTETAALQMEHDVAKEHDTSLSSRSLKKRGKKRKHDATKSLRLEPIDYANGAEVPCIFVKSVKKTLVPVPLWCQYRAIWRDFDFDDAKWIQVSNYEFWVMELVDAITNKSVRVVAKTFVDHFRKQFHACLKATTADDPPQDSDDDAEDSPQGNSVSPTAEVTIGATR